MASSTISTCVEYAKRPGTTGIRGQLYESKLLSLIYFRAVHDDNIREFYLATNVDKMGSFDDICIRAMLKGEAEESIAAFIQVKHRENNPVLSLQEKDLVEYFESYLAIRQRFQQKNKDVMFKGAFNATDCLFVIYTNAKLDKTIKTVRSRNHSSRYDLFVINLLGTGKTDGLWLDREYYSDMLGLTKKIVQKQLSVLAVLIAKCAYGELHDSQMLMQDALVKSCHVILARNVFDVSDNISEGHRTARFRQDFFDHSVTNEEYLRSFKDALCTEILKKRSDNNHKEFNLFSSFMLLREVTDVVSIYKELGSFIIYENGKFEFLDRTIPACAAVLFLSKINESEDTIRKTLELAVKDCLPSLEFRVPASFGNKDLTIRGDDSKVEKKLDNLTNKILSSTNQLETLIDIDESMGEGFLQLNGGIASAVGNLLVSEYNDLNYLSFNNNYESLGKLAKRLYDKLETKMSFPLSTYTIRIRSDICPKLSFESKFRNIFSDECDFFNSLVFCTSQYNEENVESTLISEINNSRINNIHTSNAIFLKYHDEVQNWWMKPKVGRYLTKTDNFYELVKKSYKPLLFKVINMILRNKYKKYTFSEEAVNSIKIDEQSSVTIVVTENSALTVAKLTQLLDTTDCVVLDLEYILNLFAEEYQTLRSELQDTKEVKTVVVIFNKASIPVNSDKTNKHIENIVNSIQGKKIVIVTDQTSIIIAEKYFSQIGKIIVDKRNKLNDMCEESQKSILKNTKLIFQSNEVSLDQILDDTSMGYVDGILYKIIHNNNNKIGKPISNWNDLSDLLYIPRTVTSLTLETQHSTKEIRVEERIGKRISTLMDLTEHVVIVGDPGIGKSTLLTHLSIKTKELDPTVWILRVNLLEHSRQFYEWQENKTTIDTVESLFFFCKVALCEECSQKADVQIILEECNGTVLLTDCTGDEWTVFQLNIFLHYYNTKNIIFLFDGFDEICPTYAKEVWTLLKVVKNSPQKHKMWVTSRSYDKIITDLEIIFGTLYKIKPLTKDEQRCYLYSFWTNTNLMQIIDYKYSVLRNINDFVNILSKSDYLNKLNKKDNLQLIQSKSKTAVPFITVFISLVEYIKFNTCRCHDKKFADAIISFCDTYDALLNSNGEEINEFVATPLHLLITAQYLFNRLMIENPTINKWDFDTNIFDIYRGFLETKLIKIHLQEKNKHHLHNPFNIELYERVYGDIVERHKKLAAYALYGKSLLDKRELNQCQEMITELKEGKESAGIISAVVRDTPVFVHSTFAEYFAVEHICDLLKSKRNPKSTWDFILNDLFLKANMNVLFLLDAKMKTEEELTILVGQQKHIIFKLLLKQNTYNKHGQIKSSLCEAIRYDLRNLVYLLLSTIEDCLEQRHLVDLIRMVKETNMFIVAVKMEFEDVVARIVDSLRIYDESKVRALIENIDSVELNRNIEGVSTDELVQRLHRHVWTRMDIVPEWENLTELCGQIYFI